MGALVLGGGCFISWLSYQLVQGYRKIFSETNVLLLKSPITFLFVNRVIGADASVAAEENKETLKAGTKDVEHSLNKDLESSVTDHEDNSDNMAEISKETEN